MIYNNNSVYTNCEATFLWATVKPVNTTPV